MLMNYIDNDFNKRNNIFLLYYLIKILKYQCAM